MPAITKEILKKNIEAYLDNFCPNNKISINVEEKCIIALQLFYYINNHFRSISYLFKFSFLEVVKNKAIEIINSPNSTITLINECEKVISNISNISNLQNAGIG